MHKDQSSIAQWKDLKAALQSKLDEGYLHLDSASESANKTFEDRLAKVDGPLADTLRRCQQSALLNIQLARAQRQFITAQLSQGDEVVRNTSESLRTSGKDANLPALAAGAGMAILGPLLVETSSRVVGAICLCWLLSTLLGHKEADAFVHGAKAELWGAIWDPGTGVLSLLKRLYAVASRTLRKDQDAAELLTRLADFEMSMENWRAVNVQMSEGLRFDQALSQVFK